MVSIPKLDLDKTGSLSLTSNCSMTEGYLEHGPSLKLQDHGTNEVKMVSEKI